MCVLCSVIHAESGRRRSLRFNIPLHIHVYVPDMRATFLEHHSFTKFHTYSSTIRTMHMMKWATGEVQICFSHTYISFFRKDSVMESLMEWSHILPKAYNSSLSNITLWLPRVTVNDIIWSNNGHDTGDVQSRHWSVIFLIVQSNCLHHHINIVRQ